MPRARRQPQPGRRPDARRNHVPLVRTRPHSAAVRHGPAHCRRKQEGATQFPTIGLFERNANNFKGTRNTKAQKSWSSRAEPEVRIHLPPAQSPLRTCPTRLRRGGFRVAGTITPSERGRARRPTEKRGKPIRGSRSPTGQVAYRSLSAEFGVHPTMISGWKQELVPRANSSAARFGSAPRMKIKELDD